MVKGDPFNVKYLNYDFESMTDEEKNKARNRWRREQRTKKGMTKPKVNKKTDDKKAIQTQKKKDEIAFKNTVKQSFWMIPVKRKKGLR